MVIAQGGQIKVYDSSHAISLHACLQLVSTDLDPIPVDQRTWGGLEYWAYWCSDMLAPPLASTVSSVMSLGFTARETIPIVFFGFAICSVVITLTGKVSLARRYEKYNVPYPIN